MTDRRKTLYNEVTMLGLIVHSIVYLILFVLIVIIFNKYNMSLLNAVLLGLMLGILMTYIVTPMIRSRFNRPPDWPTRSEKVRKYIKNHSK